MEGENNQSMKQTFDIAPNTLDRDWYGDRVIGRPKWALWIHGGNLHFRGGADMPPFCLDKDQGGSFVEGLWDGDVAELFLFNPATGYYLEFNLSPKGSWWCCAFDAPRRRTVPSLAPLLGTRTESAMTEAGWNSALVLPLSSLPAALAFDPETTKGNVSFCLGSPQRCITLADLGDGKPDFHRPDRFIPISGMLAHPNVIPRAGLQ